MFLSMVQAEILRIGMRLEAVDLRNKRLGRVGSVAEGGLIYLRPCVF